MLKRKSDSTFDAEGKKPRTESSDTSEYEDALSSHANHTDLPPNGKKLCIDCPNSAKKSSTYGFRTGAYSNRRYCCAKHGKARGMVDLTRKTQSRPPRRSICVKCNVTSCSYGMPGGPATHCSPCREEGMVSRMHRNCIKCNTTHARFGVKGGKPTHCFMCREEGMINVQQKKTLKCTRCRDTMKADDGTTLCGPCKTKSE